MFTLLLIILPVAAALAAWLMPQQSKQISAAGSIGALIVAIAAAISLSYGQTESLHFDSGIIRGIGMHFALSINANSILLILLTTGVFVFVTLIPNWENRYTGAYPLISLMAAAMTGAFLSSDLMLFYICYEVALIPIYFFILYWSKAENKNAIVLKFFVYTLFGSLFMLLALLYIRQFATSFMMSDMIAAGKALSTSEQTYLFLAFFIAFGVKIPIFPFHTWQPSTYSSAPIAGTMLLAGVMLKMATYGLLVFTVPMLGAGITNADWVLWICVISILYSSILAISQTRFKLLIAYSSIAHVGMIALGVLSQSTVAQQGALIEMVSHGILAVGLFFVADMQERRYGHDDMTKMGGIREHHSLFSFLFFVIVMGSVALPLTSGFVGEFLLLQGIGSHSIGMALLAGFTVVFGAVYMLRSFQQVMLGTSPQSAPFTAMQTAEKWLLIAIVTLVVLIGVYPNVLMDIVHKAQHLSIK
jgi:NADH-quinone oxidoreductase subunit M